MARVTKALAASKHKKVLKATKGTMELGADYIKLLSNRIKALQYFSETERPEKEALEICGFQELIQSSLSWCFIFVLINSLKNKTYY